MPPRYHANSNRPSNPRGYALLEQKLSLLAWLHQHLGYKTTGDLLSSDLKYTNEGFDAEGSSYIHEQLVTQSGRLQGIRVDDLKRYDNNIRQHLTVMNHGRLEPVTLRYFQYLAALYTEIYLDHYCNNSNTLLLELNQFVASHNATCLPEEKYQSFANADLGKLAYWMATGSGKTLLMHLNYRQFLCYSREPLDNILLITPNEGLSQQHLDELSASNIPAARFNLNESGKLLDEANIVKVTEITKLVSEKRGEGASIPVEVFEGNNLIFVDEGHKGSGGEAWRTARGKLGETGFTFEYSATFGQALAASSNESLLTEYGKTIAFDYSYRHFYNDGYGKDFHILNLQQDDQDEQTDILLLANLLSFYEQLRVFTEQRDALRLYNLAKPLWTFVGGSVNAVYRKHHQSRSDILTVVRFLHRVLSEPGWAKVTIKRLLNGESGLTADNGSDIFETKFEFLRHLCDDAATVYTDVLSRVMHVSSSGGLHLGDLHGSDGELGLRAAGAKDYFGVIYIGDKSTFKKLVASAPLDIVMEDDVLSGSLFDQINEQDTTIEVLVGSRKFMEGWNSWRVSNMGLLNIGKSEGAQIIQLFGRGVRLRGRNMTLQRSSTLDGPHPKHIRLLETLNIFAVRADYMSHFHRYLENEGVSTGAKVELPVPIRPNQAFLDQGLVIPRLEEGCDFMAIPVMFQHDDNVRPVYVDMSATVQELSSSQSGLSSASTGIKWLQIPPESLALVDWNRAYLDLLEHKESKGLDNLLIPPTCLRGLLETEICQFRLMADESLVKPRSQAGRERLQEAVTTILRKYIDALYRHRQTHWESNHLSYKTLDATDLNFQLNVGEDSQVSKYIVKVNRDDTKQLQEIEQLIEDSNALYHDDQVTLPCIHFDRHLYQPLLLAGSDKVQSSPPGLVESERQFVADLRDYYANQSDRIPEGTELFLLRNLARGKGVSFFTRNRFYPDFILWIKTPTAQRIVFVEPHGMIYAQPYEYDEKARLHEKLPELAHAMAQRSGVTNVELDSFIVSATPYSELCRRYDEGNWTKTNFAAKHILFPEHGYDYLEKILRV